MDCERLDCPKPGYQEVNYQRVNSSRVHCSEGCQRESCQKESRQTVDWRTESCQRVGCQQHGDCQEADCKRADCPKYRTKVGCQKVHCQTAKVGCQRGNCPTVDYQVSCLKVHGKSADRQMGVGCIVGGLVVGMVQREIGKTVAGADRASAPCSMAQVPSPLIAISREYPRSLSLATTRWRHVFGRMWSSRPGHASRQLVVVAAWWLDRSSTASWEHASCSRRGSNARTAAPSAPSARAVLPPPPRAPPFWPRAKYIETHGSSS